jgi:hypothetical protein
MRPGWLVLTADPPTPPHSPLPPSPHSPPPQSLCCLQTTIAEHGKGGHLIKIKTVEGTRK